MPTNNHIQKIKHTPSELVAIKENIKSNAAAINELNKTFINEDAELIKKMEFASELMEISYVTNMINNVNKKKMLYLYKAVDRAKAVGRLSLLLKDMEVAIYLEAGIFEFTLVYGLTKNITTKLYSAIYNDKLYDVIANLDATSSVENNTFKTALLNGELNAQQVAFLKPQDLHPERWKEIVRKVKLREEKKKNIATTDLYTCKKCGEKKCQVTEMQTRGLDEPMTKFITCLVCNNVFKK